MLVRKHAKARYLRIGERKLRQVARLLKGMRAEEALDKLNFLPKRKIAVTIAKTLKSAVANAMESDMGGARLRPEDLMISLITVDGGPVQRRYEFRAMGRVNRIQRRFSHLTIEVSGEATMPAERPARGKKASSGAKSAPVKKTAAKKTVKKKAAAKKTTAKKAAKKTAKKTTAKKTAAKKTAKKTAG